MYPKIPLCLLVKIVLCFDSLIIKKKKKKKNWNFDFLNRNSELELKNRKNSAKIGMVGRYALVAVQHALRTFTMLQTERDDFAVEYGLQNIVNVRNHVALPLMHEE